MRKIESIGVVGSNVMELHAALTKLVGHARIASSGQLWGGSSSVDVTNEDGEELAEISLWEETLSDKSRVYNVTLRFSNVE